MSDLQVPITATSAGDEGMQGRPEVPTQNDFNRFRSVMDKQLSKVQKAAAIERQRANQAESQLRQLLSASEKQMLVGMKPEERQRYLAQKRDKDLLATKQENRRLRKQSHLDGERDRVLREYGLRGDEQGIDYSNWERFVRTAHATSVMQKTRVQQALQKTRATSVTEPPKAENTDDDETSQAGTKTAARVDAGGPVRVRPVIGSVDSIEKAAWSLTRGTPSQRREAFNSLRKARAEAVGA